jgi:hypothetical protein
VSYAAFGLDCPPGFVAGAGGVCVAATATQCPPGFQQTTSGECWPQTAQACKTIGAFYDPRQPDRCKKECPSDTIASAGVCQPKLTGGALLTQAGDTAKKYQQYLIGAAIGAFLMAIVRK